MRTLKTYNRHGNPLTVMVLLAGAMSVYSQGIVSSQGYVSMNDYNGGVGIGMEIQVFPSQPIAASTVFVSVNGYSGYEEMGQSGNTYLPNPGRTVYSTGQSTIGPGYDVGLLALDGGGATSYSQLSQVPLDNGTYYVSQWWNNEFSQLNPTLNNNYGIWNTTASAIIPGSATFASVAIAVWQGNGSFGAATTLAQAQADGYEWGVSSIQTTPVASADSPTSVWLPQTLTSFSLVDPVPEPGTIALGLLGASALLFRRRK